MKIRLLFYILLSFGFAESAFAVQKTGRIVPVVVSVPDNPGEAGKPEMTVKIDEGKPVYIHKNRKFDCSGAVNHGGGCTRVVFLCGDRRDKTDARRRGSRNRAADRVKRR